MLSFKSSLLAIALAVSSLAAQATTVALPADGSWKDLSVESSIATTPSGTEWVDNYLYDLSQVGSALSFDFTIGAGSVGTLTVVDAGFAGDTFHVYNNGSLLGSTSAVPVQYYSESAVGTFDYDGALADSSFSRAVFTLGAGTYSISGSLAQSLMLTDPITEVSSPLNSTTAGIKLSISPVPEPSSIALVLAALGLIWMVSRRSAAR